MDFLNWLGEEGVPFVIVFTKTDKISKGRLADNIAAYTARLQETWEELPTIFYTSSEHRLGGDEILNYIDKINKTL